jgi:phosphinothricin acetyltransferase
MNDADYILEPMTPIHREAVIGVYNHYVVSGFAAYPDAPVDPGAFDRFAEMARGYPAFVARDASGAVAGFAFAHPYGPAPVFRRTAQLTYFILPAHTRLGLGTRLLEALLGGLRAMGVDNALAHVSSLNARSLAFHARHGFTECGRLPAIGRKFGEDFDVVWFQKKIAPRPEEGSRKGNLLHL